MPNRTAFRAKSWDWKGLPLDFDWKPLANPPLWLFSSPSSCFITFPFHPCVTSNLNATKFVFYPSFKIPPHRTLIKEWLLNHTPEKQVQGYFRLVSGISPCKHPFHFESTQANGYTKKCAKITQRATRPRLDQSSKDVYGKFQFSRRNLSRNVWKIFEKHTFWGLKAFCIYNQHVLLVWNHNATI